MWFLLSIALAFLGLSLASPLAPVQAIEERDAQATDIGVIYDVVAKTGWDEDSRVQPTEDDLARLSAEDAQVLSAELNKWAQNHDDVDLIIPAFADESWRSWSESIASHAAAATTTDIASDEIAERAEHPGLNVCGNALVETRQADAIAAVARVIIDVCRAFGQHPSNDPEDQERKLLKEEKQKEKAEKKKQKEEKKKEKEKKKHKHDGDDSEEQEEKTNGYPHDWE